ncbi:hypothetical protein GGD41_002461 [Paraburkholderia bryophila]|uniref:Uncharacterized protein n=1 Tax=Paraburkholderia bryophila TaxID=420952 RepID=A0A7Y9W841_9BURK|nr:hypothetical protein [Paraburkholderia bryophila]
MARIEPRLLRLERMEPVGMFGVERAIGGHPVDHQIGQQGHATLMGRGRKCADRLDGGPLRLEYRMQPGVIADHLPVACLPRLEETADQCMIEAQRGGVRELRGPRGERSNQK